MTRRRTHDRGQSLVETALFLPVFLLLIVGILEISNLLILQSRVATATRTGVGFGASHYDPIDWCVDPDNPKDWSGTAGAMGQVVLNTITETMDLSPARWDIWSIRAKTNSTGDAFVCFDAEHVYGSHQVVSLADWTTIEPQEQADLIAELQSTGVVTVTKDLEVVAAIAYHKPDSLLGLPVNQWIGKEVLRSSTVMRIDKPETAVACSAFPIALSPDNRSVWPSDEPAVPPGDESFPSSTSLSASSGTSYWAGAPMTPPPQYTTADPSAFPAHVPGVPLLQARPGYLYLARRSLTTVTSTITSTLQWLRWNVNDGPGDEAPLQQSLTWPGNSSNYYYPNWSDDGLSLFDPVPVSYADVSFVRDAMRDHVDKVRGLRLLIFTPVSLRGGDYNGDGTGTAITGGGSDQFEVLRLAVFRLLAWDLPDVGDNWLLLEFVRWNEDCGL